MPLKYLQSSFCLILAFALTPQYVNAQKSNEQMWFEYMLNVPFANSFNLENAFTYSTLLNKNDKWRGLDYSPTVEYAVDQHFDIIGAVTLSYTMQTETYNSFEFRPMIGAKIHFTPNRRILTRLLLRYEMRNFKNLETKAWETVWRPRARFESIIPINQKSFFKDNLWYGILDAEYLFTKNEVDERFANRFRLRTGIGYRFSNSWRFEFLYMYQASKNANQDDFDSSDNVFRFRVKHFINKAKPSTATGVGN